MKKKLQPVITLLQQYMAQDMTVYAGHATLFLLTAFFPLLMWLLVVVNTLPGFTVDSVVELFFRFLPVWALTRLVTGPENVSLVWWPLALGEAATLVVALVLYQKRAKKRIDF